MMKVILLCSHDAVDDKVGAAVEHEPEVLEGCEGEHPAGDRHGEGEEEDDAPLGWTGISPFAQQRFVLSLTLDWMAVVGDE